jgi:hypothetical protein
VAITKHVHATGIAQQPRYCSAAKLRANYMSANAELWKLGPQLCVDCVGMMLVPPRSVAVVCA